jgi:hypothetical protein
LHGQQVEEVEPAGRSNTIVVDPCMKELFLSEEDKAILHYTLTSQGRKQELAREKGGKSALDEIKKAKDNHRSLQRQK